MGGVDELGLGLRKRGHIGVVVEISTLYTKRRALYQRLQKEDWENFALERSLQRYII